jgi:DNA mismatch endonuclease (patch repair protein)
MSDVFTKRKRSEVMARIRGRGNEDTEVALATLLRTAGLTGWRRQVVLKIKEQERRARRSRPTRIRADFVFRRQRVAVFVDGCFWHACPIHATKPRNNATFWRKKLAANQARDKFVTRTLRRQGWTVIRIWEHELAKNSQRCIAKIRRNLVTPSGRKFKPGTIR